MTMKFPKNPIQYNMCLFAKFYYFNEFLSSNLELRVNQNWFSRLRKKDFIDNR